jgi:hypothetical protein
MWADGPDAPWADRPDAMWADGPVPSADSPTAMLAGLRPPRDPGGPRPPRRPLGPRRPLLIVIAAAAVVAIVAGIVLVKALSGSPPASGATGTASATSPASSQDGRRQAAVQMDRLLAQSVTDRAAVTNAAEDVRACGPSLSQDAQTFAHSASSRQQLLGQLASLPGRSLLPAALLQDLTSAWQASAQVDNDLARWAQDNATRGCHHHKGRSDAFLRASAGPEARATVGKRAFAARWNPIARQYGLKTYERNEL